MAHPDNSIAHVTPTTPRLALMLFTAHTSPPSDAGVGPMLTAEVSFRLACRRQAGHAHRLPMPSTVLAR